MTAVQRRVAELVRGRRRQEEHALGAGELQQQIVGAVEVDVAAHAAVAEPDVGGGGARLRAQRAVERELCSHRIRQRRQREVPRVRVVGALRVAEQRDERFKELAPAGRTSDAFGSLTGIFSCSAGETSTREPLAEKLTSAGGGAAKDCRRRGAEGGGRGIADLDDGHAMLRGTLKVGHLPVTADRNVAEEERPS